MRARGPVLVAVACLWASSAVGQSRGIAIFSYQDTSCGAWVGSSDDLAVRAQYHSWFRGFVSGYNFGNPGNQVLLARMPDEQTLYLFVDKYCRDNPLKPFVSAALKLVEELREFPVPQGTSTR